MKFSYCLFLFCVFIVLSVPLYADEPAADTSLSESLQENAQTPLKLTDYQSVYDRPYSFTDNTVDTKMLGTNTVVLFGAGFAAMGVLYMMPASVTNWEDDDKSPFEKWWHNVSRPPVWDEDDLWLNYIAHPYVGAIYYMGARSAGASVLNSTLYAFALSTFFWEYGIEAFAERPSIQDLIVTPVGGALVGEAFYLAKRHIVENDYRLLNSRILGYICAFLMDPITEITNLFRTHPNTSSSVAVYAAPSISRDGHLGYSITLNILF